MNRYTTTWNDLPEYVVCSRPAQPYCHTLFPIRRLQTSLHGGPRHTLRVTAVPESKLCDPFEHISWKYNASLFLDIENFVLI